MEIPNMWEAAQDAVSVLDAHDDPEVVELYFQACDALARYGTALSARGVSKQQVFGQLQGAPNAVLFRSLGWDK